jgi:hypothetical protein
LQFNELPNISEVETMSVHDYECLSAIRTVLQNYGCISRFGVTLLHNHFHLAEDEILVESCDTNARTLISRPRKISELDFNRLIETVWRWDKRLKNACEQVCPTDEKGNHYGYKDHY